MEAWHDFFVGELGAAAALAGLLFVSLSVNQERILKLPGLAQRGIQGLTSLFLVFAIDPRQEPAPSPSDNGSIRMA